MQCEKKLLKGVWGILSVRSPGGGGQFEGVVPAYMMVYEMGNIPSDSVPPRAAKAPFEKST